MSISKTIITSFILLAIGLASITISIWRFPPKMLQEENFKAEITPFNIIFYDKDGKNAFKISPLDDYLYTDSTKDHFVKDSNFKQNRNLVNEIKHRNDLIWSISKDEMEITYEVHAQGDNTVQILRKFENLPSKINSAGQAVAFCGECWVSNDDQTLVYLREDMITTEMLDAINNLNLIPLVVKEQLPVNISKLIILDHFGHKKLELEVSPDDRVYFLQDWNILEIKTPIYDSKQTNLSQTVKFY